MNAARRKQLDAVLKTIDEFKPMLAFKEATEILSDLEDRAGSLKEELEGIRDEEQEAFEAMPEGLQSSEKGQAAQEAISAMENAIEYIDSFGTKVYELLNEQLGALEEDLDQAVEAIGEARGE